MTFTPEWESKMREANESFRMHEYDSAIQRYKRALHCARHQFHSLLSENPDQAFACVMICYYNLAETHWLESNQLMAAHQFIECFQFLEQQQLRLCDDCSATLEAFNRALEKTEAEFVCLTQRLQITNRECQSNCIEEIELLAESIKSRNIH